MIHAIHCPIYTSSSLHGPLSRSPRRRRGGQEKYMIYQANGEEHDLALAIRGDVNPTNSQRFRSEVHVTDITLPRSRRCGTDCTAYVKQCSLVELAVLGDGGARAALLEEITRIAAAKA